MITTECHQLLAHDTMVSGMGIMPWHRIGTVVDGYLTAADALKKAKLDFTVAKEPIYTADGREIKGSFVMTRKDIDLPLGIVGNRYTPIQNVDGLDILDPIIGKDAVYETAGSLRNGKIVWFLAKLKEEYFLKNKDDRAQQYCLVHLSHDGSRPVTVRYTSVRTVCMNTVSMALKGSVAEVTIRHTSGYRNKVEEAHKILKLADVHAREFSKIMMDLDRVKVSNAQAKSVINTLFPSPTNRASEVRSNIFDLFQNGRGNSGETAADLVNGVSEYTSHRTLKASKLISADERKTQDVLFGEAQVINNKVLELAMALN